MLRVKIAGLENEIERFKKLLLTKAEEAKAEKAMQNIIKIITNLINQLFVPKYCLVTVE